MAKRRVSLAQLRELVTARRTKGAAFSSKSHKEYEELMDKVAQELNALDYKEILTRFPIYTYDIKN